MSTPTPVDPASPESKLLPSSNPPGSTDPEAPGVTRVPVRALPELRASDLRSPPRRRIGLPIVLFIATCLSTFWVGAAGWRPQLINSADVWQVVSTHWQQGLTYIPADA
jgi:hypothetical protein